MLGLRPSGWFSAGLDAKAPPARTSVSVSLATILNASGRDETMLSRPKNYALMEQKYGLSAWVYLATSKKARDLSSAPIIAKIDDKELEPSHDLMRLLTHVNPWMTFGGLWGVTSKFLDLTGNAFWLFIRDKGGMGKAREIYPVNPMAVTILSSPTALISGYELAHNGGLLRLRAYQPGIAGDLLHFRLDNPIWDGNSAFPSPWGIGPLEAGWSVVTTDEEAVRWNRNLVKNDGRPSGILTSDLEINADEAAEAANRYRESFAGATNAGKVLVLGKNLTYTRVGDTPKDMDYINTRAALREEILALFGCNSAIFGLAQGDVGRRDEAVREYWQGTIVSTSESDLCPPLTEFLAPEYGENIEVSQDFSKTKALQANEEGRSQYVQRYWTMGVPLKELNRRFELGFEEAPGWDRALIPLSVQDADAEPEPEPEFDPLAFPPGQPPVPGQPVPGQPPTPGKPRVPNEPGVPVGT